MCYLKLLRVVVHVVDHYVFHTLRRVPRDEVIVLLFHLKEQVEHRNEGDERENIEDSAQEIEH